MNRAQKILIEWSQAPNCYIIGSGNHISLRVPLHCMRPLDELLIQHVMYRSGQLHIEADILRKPFLSPYTDPQRFEPHYVGQDVDFFKENCDVEKKESGTPLTHPRLS
jgi:hypothetical protein